MYICNVTHGDVGSSICVLLDRESLVCDFTRLVRAGVSCKIDADADRTVDRDARRTGDICSLKVELYGMKRVL